MASSNITTTRVYRVNGRLVIADNPIEAINLFNDYYNKREFNCKEEVESLKVVKDEDYICPSSSALVKQQERVSKEELKAWIIKNIRQSNMSDDSLAESLYSLVYK